MNWVDGSLGPGVRTGSPEDQGALRREHARVLNGVARAHTEDARNTVRLPLD